jgi:Uma2 family endonuclease
VIRRLEDAVSQCYSPQCGRHRTGTRANFLAERFAAFRAALDKGYSVREEKPIELSDSLPEPDIAIVRGVQLDYASRYPGASDVVLAVEVAVTSQQFDRDKARIYARGGVALLWLIDVPAQRLEIHGDPQPDGRYRLAQVLGESDDLLPPVLAVRWKVREVFC